METESVPLRRRAAVFASISALFAVMAAGCAPTASPAESTVAPGESTAATPRAAEPPDYLVLAPRAFVEELAPLIELRKHQGHSVSFRAVEDVYAARSSGSPTPEALRDEIAAIAGATSPQKLHYVLLAGDPKEGPAIVPSFFDSIGADWIPEGFEAHPHRTDQGFAMFDSKAPLAVGRLPARTEQEMSAMVGKIVRYEGGSAAGAWQRKVLVFGGPANFGPVADGVLEAQATSLLDQLLPYDYDVGVIFAKPDSPYVYRYDQLGTKIIGELNEGSLLAVYAGHGLEDSFDRARYRGRRYPIGTVKEVEGLDITHGAPIFISLTCLTGDYGRASGQRSIAETMVLNPHGPVAVFAASDVSHPYPNLLYAQSLLDSFILKRSPTVGDGIVAAKKSMLDRSIPFASLLVPGDLDAIKKQHLTVYNLFGDPATEVRLPLAATVEPRQTSLAPGESLHLSVKSDGLTDAPMKVTIETERSALKPGIVSSPEIEAMPLEEAFTTMAKNYEIATDKVVNAAQGQVKAGRAEMDIAAPKTPGHYIAKVLIVGDKTMASGHVAFDVK